MNLLCADALSVDWSEFTKGTDHVHVVGNPPFITHKFRKGNHIYNSILGKGFSSFSTELCWLVKAKQFHYTSVFLLGNAGNTYSVKFDSFLNYHGFDCLVTEPTKWLGDASLDIVLYQLIPGVRALPSDNCPVVPSRRKLTGWIHGVTITSGAPVVTGYILSQYCHQKVEKVETRASACYIPADNSPWSIQAWNSKAFQVWQDRTCNPTVHLGRKIQHLSISRCVNTFPLFEGDDLSHFETMSDEEIWDELYNKYKELVHV